MTWQQIFKSSKIINLQNYQIYFQFQKKQHLIKDFNAKISQCVPEKHENFNIIFYKYFQVQFENEKKQAFKEGTLLNAIKKKFQIKGKGYVFFDQNNQHYQEDQIGCNLYIKKCLLSNIRYKSQNFQHQQIPVNVSLREIYPYLSKKTKQKLNAQVQVINVALNTHEKKINDLSLTLNSIQKEASIRSIIFGRKCRINLIYQNHENSNSFEAFAFDNQTIGELKKKFVSKFNLNPEQQIWKISNVKLKNNDTFQSLQIKQKYFNIYVTQKQNLELYGFRYEKPIKSNIYSDLYIQDDDKFKNQVQNSQFPSSKYEDSFRITALRILFASIKKHRRLQSALDDIRRLILSSSKKQHKVWQSINEQTTNFLNQHYVMKNILNSLQRQIQMEFMRMSKTHSPLPIIAKNIKGQRVNYFQSHFWITNKSFTISSIGLDQKVKGKSFLLNQIFNTQFQVADSRHPSSSQTVYIKYNIYRTEDNTVDLIDISKNSLEKKQIKQLLQISNIIIIHYKCQQSSNLEQFIKENQIEDKILIIIERDSNDQIIERDSNDYSKEQKQEKKIFIKMPQIHASIIKRYDLEIIGVSNKVNKCIKKEIDFNEKQSKWNLLKYFCKKSDNSKNIIKYYDLIREIQKQFDQIFDQKFSQLRYNLIKKIIETDQFDQCDLFMSKIRQFSRFQRSQLMNKINILSTIESSIQKQQIKQSLNNETNQTIEKIIKKLDLECKQKLTSTLKCKLLSLKKTQMKAKSDQLKQIKDQIQSIKKRLFSIENFWRQIYQNFQKLKENSQQSFSKLNSISLFKKEVTSSKSFEILNGDQLKIPYSFLKQVASQDKRKMKVVGILGIQSSGKSTLLNFLFGCDFMSSQGRCTNGIYGSIYNISNYHMENCQSILVLDTEGLFGNHERSQKNINFDNKLVLFLLQVCDIIVLNLRGDVDVKTQKILQVAFDSTLMTKQKSSNYPHFLIVLNRGNQTHLQKKQKQEIQVMKQKIEACCPQMTTYIRTDQSASLPNAFYYEKSSQGKQVLESMLKTQKTPIDKYYNQTKKLMSQLLNILFQGDRSEKGKNFENIINDMYSNWRLIMEVNILTKHESKQLKQEEKKLDQFKKLILQELDIKNNQWRAQLDQKNYKEFWEWQQKILNRFQDQKKKIRQKFTKTFQYKDDTQKRQYIKSKFQQIMRQQVDLIFNKLKNIIKDKEIYFDIEISNQRGMLKIKNRVYEIKYKNVKLSEEKIDKQFEQIWKSSTDQYLDFYKQQNIEKQQFNKIQRYFNQHLITKNEIIGQIQKNKFQQCKNNIKQNSKQIWKKINKELFKFKSNKKPPIIISLGKKGISSLNQFYLNIEKNFFQLKENQTKLFYLNTKWSVDSLIQKQSLNKLIFEELKKTSWILMVQYNTLLILKQLKIEVQKNKITQIYAKTCIQIEEHNQKYRGMQKYIDRHAFTNQIKKKLTNLKIDIKQLSHYQQIIKTNSFQLQNLQIIQNSSLSNQQKYQLLYFIKQQIFLVKKADFQAQKQNNLIDSLTKAIKRFIQSKIFTHYLKNKVETSNQILRLKAKFRLQAVDQIAKVLGLKANTQNGIINNAYKIFKTDKPHIIQNEQDIDKIKNKFSKLIIKDFIKISSQKNEIKNYDQIIVAKQIISQYQVKNVQFKSYFNFYKNQNFKKFQKALQQSNFKKMFQQRVQFDRFYEKIEEKIQSIKQKKMNIENSVRQTLQMLKIQIDFCNDDLQQICSCLNDITIKNLYYFAFTQLFRHFLNKQLQQAQKKVKKLNQQKVSQATFFKNIINRDSNQTNKGQALAFINAYKKHLKQEQSKIKNEFLQKKKKQFCEKVKRHSFQKQVKKKIEGQNNENIIQYIQNPYEYLKKMYDQKVQKQINQLNSEFSSIILPNFLQLLEIITKLQKNFQTQIQSKYQVDNMFQQNANQQKMNQIFKTLLTNKRLIDCQTLDNKLKKNILFQNQKLLSKNENINFFNKSAEYKISNVKFFLKHLLNNLQKFKEQQKNSWILTENDKNQFKQKIQFSFCKAKCPCCGKLCDKQTRSAPSYQIQIIGHRIHQCSTGHQPRAIAGVRVKSENSNNSYGSIIACQNSKQASILVYNNKQIANGQLKQKMKNKWSFEKRQNLIYDEKFLQVFWDKFGQNICQYRTKQDKQQMKFISYIQGMQKMRETEQQLKQKHYIVAIDESGSMKGQKQERLLKQLNQIVPLLFKNPNNLLSIVKFNQNYSIFKQALTKNNEIDFQAITFSGGDTSFSEALKGMILCFQSLKKKTNLHLILISDGTSDFPTKQINKLIQIKMQQQRQQLTLQFSTIFIEQSSYYSYFYSFFRSQKVLKEMCQKLKGNSFKIYIDNLSKIMKEVLINSNKNKIIELQL